jgi:hypothetical protein
MKSEVECTVGFSRSIVATGTPDLAEMTTKVSPAATVQYLVAVRALVVVVADVVATTCLRGAGEPTVVAVRCELPASTPERIRITAIVAASRNAAGAR